MTCTTCGATIADKAIVCYRCGAATAAPPAPQRPATPRRAWRALAMGLVLAAAALLVLYLLRR